MSSSELTVIQELLMQHLQNAVSNTSHKQFVYYTEWLGYLPFGMYHWVQVDGKDVDSLNSIEPFGSSDLRALVTAGWLQVMDEWQHPDDPCESRTTFKVV